MKSINFAMQQNYVPIIRNIVVTNETENTLFHLDLKITFEPEFAKEYNYHIDEIKSGESVEIVPVRIQLKTEFLFSLTEKMLGIIVLELFQENEKIYTSDTETEVLAYDQWSGLIFMPEIVTAFITPNHPKIAEVISDASEVLRKWTNNPAFTGYQTNNPNNVKLQMAAIYVALQGQEIIYNNPPASYEMIGQRIRLPHIVLEKKQGTCLDLAILYAACLEAVGLFPLLLFIRGHAFGGCWLEEQTFADCMVDDVSAIEKRIVAGAEEILLVECTDFVSGKNIEFDKSLKHGKDHFINLSDFLCGIDVQRSRGSGIRPLPLRLEQAYLMHDESGREDNKEIKDNKIPAVLDSSMLGRSMENKIPITKQKIWERKLLDFSLRNTLLNFRVTKNAFQLMTADLGELEDRLADGKDFRIMEVPSEWTVSLRDSKIFEIENEKDLIQSIAMEEFKSSRIRTFLEEEELEKNIKSLYRSAKNSMEENGTNTLFLALGFLRWFESDLSEKARYAPIVLIPVDIVKNTRNKGYVIRSRQEDTQINITLLEYLRQDHDINISGLDPLPEDEHGIDLPLVFHIIRQAVMEKKRWNIEEMAFVGLFSFGQFVMWNDIRNHSKELEKNKVVSSLIQGTMNWEPEIQKVNVENLDKEVSLKDMAIPVSADSSQLVAIRAAAQGQSFVLHGPPGTGKSQTITNMIASALYQGKSVLFVAEKMAALNVVQKRLAEIGLDPFCLELHSNKTNKSVVLTKLNKVLEIGKIKHPEEYEDTARKVHELRNKLNYIIEALHSKREYGVSLYEAIELYEGNLEQRGKIKFERNILEKINKDIIGKWDELIRQYVIASQELGDYEKHPFAGYEGMEYSIELRDRMQVELQELILKNEQAQEHLQIIYQWAGYTEEKSKKTLVELLNVVDIVTRSKVVLADLIQSPNFEGIVMRIQQLIQLGMEYNKLYAQLAVQFEPSIFDYDVEAAKLQWKQTEISWSLAKKLNQNKLLKELKLYAKNTATISIDNIQMIYDALILLRGKKREILETPAELVELLGGLFMGIKTDWSEVVMAIESARAIRNVCSALNARNKESVLSAIKTNFQNNFLGIHKNKVLEYMNALNRFQTQYKVKIDEQNNDADWFSSVRQVLTGYLNHMNELRNMVTFNQMDYQLSMNGLENVSNAYKNGKVSVNELYAAYTCNLYYTLVLMTIEKDNRLAEFHGKQYNDMIAQYKDNIEKYQQLTIQELVARLSAKVPAAGTASATTSEMGILKKAIKSNGRMMSIRSLFEQIPILLRKLCPCMLMSPISVAQYLDPSFPKFDLVIFDEASQMPTSEAVGAIARGENAIIVGDPKQLPPTNFFASSHIDEENSEKEDLESLLDDCLAISMPQESLKWHYRSRHESLIAYSNMKYYDNKLYTFPSPKALNSEVKMVHVEGFYDKGKTKQNKAEAKAVVEEIICRLRDEELRNESIGVVTFSSVQQNLIEDMLDEEFRKCTELEEINHNSNEPIFIKNLENVQGDERDVILFSVGYGPDADGNVSMNFGPLNRDGGWRRLNVAISRARKTMIVYSVLRPEQINLSRTRSEGVAGLKGFLEYAEHGKSVLAQRVDVNRKQEDYLVNKIAASIAEMGYDVKCNIGCSQFKMDIGIVNPEKKDTFLLGILLDGENCKEAATARDRFVLQPNILKGLGWSVIRLWTLEWLDDEEKVKKEIKEAIENALLENKKDRKIKKKENIQIKFEKLEEVTETHGKKYISSMIAPQGTIETFFLPETASKIRFITSTIITQEAPISKKLLLKKVMNIWQLPRGGSKVEEVFEKILGQIDKISTKDENREFFWRINQIPEKYAIYRVEDEEGNKRSMDDIPSEEILNAIVQILNVQVSLSEEDLIRETAREFSFSRPGNIIETSVRYAIEKGINREKLVRSGSNKIGLRE